MSRLQIAADKILNAYGHETAHLEPTEQLQVASIIISELSRTMVDIYCDGIVEIHKDARERYVASAADREPGDA